MAYIAQGPITNGATLTRVFKGGNVYPADQKTLGTEDPNGGGGGPTIPTEGVIWWPKK